MSRDSRRFRDRTEAGRLLGEAIAEKGYADPVVLALPRGGIPIAIEVARALAAPMDLILVRKIGVPSQPELAAGAIVDGGEPETIYNDNVIAMTGLTRDRVDELGKRQLEEIERRRALYLKDRPAVPVAGRTAIVVDDGIATGATARAALHAMRRKQARKVVLAVPVGPSDTLASFAGEADEVICLSEPAPFYAIGIHYLDFRQLDDDDVIELMAEADRLAGDETGPSSTDANT
jgi:putative phosphoribosyl transferase